MADASMIPVLKTATIAPSLQGAHLTLVFKGQCFDVTMTEEFYYAESMDLTIERLEELLIQLKKLRDFEARDISYLFVMKNRGTDIVENPIQPEVSETSAEYGSDDLSQTFYAQRKGMICPRCQSSNQIWITEGRWRCHRVRCETEGYNEPVTPDTPHQA